MDPTSQQSTQTDFEIKHAFRTNLVQPHQNDSTRYQRLGSYSAGQSEQIPYYPVEPAPAQTYSASFEAPPAEAIEQGLKADVPDDTEWMSVGTYGVIPYRQNDLAYAFQLATNKDGIVRGIQWDMKSNTSVEVAGSIDKETYRVSWQAISGSGLMFESNLDELTEKEFMVNVYDPIQKSLVSWQMMAIEESDLPLLNE